MTVNYFFWTPLNESALLKRQENPTCGIIRISGDAPAE